MARASSPVEFSEARRRIPGDTDEDSQNASSSPLTTTQGLFYDSDADTDDEFQARLAEAYRECSPSRQRRLQQTNPSSHAPHAMQNNKGGLVSIFPSPMGGPVDVNGCEHARAPVFPAVVQPPIFRNEVPFSVPAPPAAVPNLSQVFAPQPRMPAAPEASCLWPPVQPVVSLAGVAGLAGTPAERRDSDSSTETACTGGSDFMLGHDQDKAKTSWASTRLPSAEGSRRTSEDATQDSAEQRGRFPDFGHPRQQPTMTVSIAECLSTARPAAGDPTRKKSKSSKPDEQTGTSKGYSNSWSPGVTTVMVRQLPRHWTHVMFLEEVESRGFKGLFDFVYLPHDFKKGSHVGFGFINFLKDENALDFVKEFHGLYLDDQMREAGKPLRIHPASVQGYEANRQYFATNKVANQRDPQFRPLFLPGGSWSSLESILSPAGQDARCASPDVVPAAPPAEPPSGPPKVLSSEADAGCSVPGSYVISAPGGHGDLGSQHVAAGQLPLVPAADDSSQWWSLEEERQKLLMELASVQESRRALATSLMGAVPAQPVPGPR